MPDYVYLLENRLSADQRHALSQLRAIARDAETILFLTGDAVRDLTSGHAVRDLEVTIHGNALKLKKALEKAGASIWGEYEPSRTLYLCFPGTVRVDLISAHGIEFPKPGKPVYHFTNIQDDLRRRDFTVNAMAISLNEGSYGLFMDPLNGAADIESRSIRLVSNYGFIEDSALLIRASRYRARLGWEMDPRTQARYDNAKGENLVEGLSPHARSRELEQIGHEEEGLKVLRALEEEGWMKVLFPAWTASKADEAKLTALHDLAVGLYVQGVHPDMSAAQMQLLTIKLQPKDLSALKKSLLRPGFVAEWNDLDRAAAGFAKVLLAKQNSKPSVSYKIFTTYDPEAVLWLGFTSKEKAVKERYELFIKTWPEARQRIPHMLMQEMRITPELPAYHDIVHAIFLELIDGRLATPEEMRAFLEPHSPPAPPPPVTIKRTRAKRGAEPKIKERSFDEDDEDAEDVIVVDDDLDGMGADDEEIDLGILPKHPLDDEVADEGDEEDLDEDESDKPLKKEQPAPGSKKGAKSAAPAKSAPPAKPAAPAKPAPPTKLVAPAKHLIAAQSKPEPKPAAAPAAKSAPAKVAAPAVKAKPAPAPRKTVKPVPAKPAAKAKSAPKVAAKAAKPAAKKPAPKAHAKPAKTAKAAKPVAKKAAKKR